MKIDRLTLIDEKTDRVSINLVARIADGGDLILEGQDPGKTVEETFGDGDYEYALKVAADLKDTVLLLLIKERFATDAEFRARLDEKRIACEFWSF